MPVQKMQVGDVNAENEWEPEPPGARYSGGEPEVEVSDVTQAETSAAEILAQEFLNFLSARLGSDATLKAINQDWETLDGLQAQVNAQAVADRTAERRASDPLGVERRRLDAQLLSQRLSHSDDLHQDNRRMIADLHTQYLAQIRETAAWSQAIIREHLADSSVARERTWGALTEIPEAMLIGALKKALAEMAAEQGA